MNKKFLAFLVGVIFVLQTVASVYADNIDESNPKDEVNVETISAQCSVDQNDIVSYGDFENVLNLTAAESETDFTKFSGSYTTDITKPYDGNWHILSWKDNFKAGCSNWDYNGNYHMDSESAFEYITGGIPNGSGITQFSIDVTNLIYQKKYVDIYVSDSLDGNWIKCDYTVADNVSDNDQNATMTGGNLRKRITFKFDKSNGYRYIKVSRVAAPEDTWAHELGGFSFAWEDIFELRENEIRVRIDDNYTDYVSESSGNIERLHDDAYGDYLGTGESSDDAYIIYSAPQGKCFKYFYVDIANGDNANIMSAYKIGALTKENGNSIPLDLSDAASIPIPGTNDNVMRFTFSDISVPYVKISFTPGSNYEYFKLGTFGFELADFNEVDDDEIITFRADTTSGDAKDWNLIKCEPAGVGFGNWTDYITNNPGEHYFFGGADNSEYDLYFGGISVGSGIREFTIDTFCNHKNSAIKVYASDKIDGEYVEIPLAFVTVQPYVWNHGDNVTKCYYRMRAAEGYRYIKLHIKSIDWSYNNGQITYTYGSVNGPELYRVESDLSNGKASITVTPLLEMFDETNATFLMTAYKDEKLVYASKSSSSIGNSAITLNFGNVPMGEGVEYQFSMLRYGADKIEFVMPPSSLKE